MRTLVLTKKFKKSAADYSPRVQEKILDVLKDFESEKPNLDLKKIQGEENLYRIKKGDFRIFYEIDKENKSFIIWNVEIRPKAYRRL